MRAARFLLDGAHTQEPRHEERMIVPAAMIAGAM